MQELLEALLEFHHYCLLVHEVCWTLCQDIPIPTFFQEKKEEDWTDEERRAAVEYQKKVKELEEEREKFRKVALLRCSSDDILFTIVKQILC